ncbi:FUSC family protein [Pandoraea aquatica]|uniref:FUSC family protein n=1 Tax=Pandoraea aquatica TaxID=2508290 RepID=A0A5E4YIE9_9BURK|nr:FUSC family protein [Pandoraea aquatica]VVE48175.1 FUSC family protein [Pandoraea aquatica]
MSSTPVSVTGSGAPTASKASRLGWLTAIVSRTDFTSPCATYVFRSIVAAWLALCVAYLLELEMPFSAATTVLLVINPVQGAVIGKGAWRVLGTLAGMVASFLLMSAFGQMPWLFLLGFSVWLGLCVAGMTMLRHFRASGVVVAGYTVGLATFGALQHPHLTFDHVIGRASTVMVGVVCLSLVSALFSARGVRGKLAETLTRLTARAAEVLAAANVADDAPSHAAAADAKRQLMTEIYGVDDLLAVGKAESVDLAHRAHAVRHAMASLFAALAGGSREPLGSTLRPMLAAAWREAARSVGTGSQPLERAARVMRDARQRLIDARTGTHAMPDASADAVSSATLIAIDQAIDQIDDYLAALDGLASLNRPRPAGAKTVVSFHRDPRAAWQNGLRSALTLFTAGAIWIVTGWPHGDMMLLIVAPYCALLAAAPNPAAGAWQFVKGSVIAVPVAFVCAFLVLPHINGLPLLLVVLALFWLPGIYATTLPQHGLAALAYLVGFNTLTAADNPMHYNLPLFLNWSVAWIVGTLVAWMGFRLLLPRVLPRDIERLRMRIRDEALRTFRPSTSIGSITKLLTASRVWKWRQQHRIASLGALRKSQPDAMHRDIADALAGLHLGREVWRVRGWMVGEGRHTQFAEVRRVVAVALDRMQRRLRTRHPEPALAARHARHAVRRLVRIQATLPPSPVAPVEARHLRRVVAALIDIAATLDAHAAYFGQPQPLAPESHAQ